MGHCSALIKILPGYEDIFAGHSRYIYSHNYQKILIPLFVVLLVKCSPQYNPLIPHSTTYHNFNVYFVYLEVHSVIILFIPSFAFLFICCLIQPYISIYIFIYLFTYLFVQPVSQLIRGQPHSHSFAY